MVEKYKVGGKEVEESDLVENKIRGMRWERYLK